MLDAETKRKIDNCRDILVGKIPDPKSQVEQITIALIYKFMDDMDQLSVDQGGKPSFFRGDFEKYSWSNIFNPRIDGYTLLNLYGEALSRMDHNPNIPQLFRDIFKNVLLPYRDPETLRLFLKEIRGFTYDHSERLGDAFEYLLSVLSSQGDAGQFRTPRHIIDFIVKVVDPQLNQTVLDPACGTAGFLISAYKHILKNNPKLSNTQKQRLMNNFVGYDIDPGMRRLSLANMYLHGFANPKIHEYDTLTSEDRWQDTFDVIMANPPFMSPKGGIRPHSRFSIQAKRSEVLFVDYIAEHLNPSGRAGVIVPEGIIFQSQNAYKALRKMLVDNYLWAVVSLPAGVFNPYSGVKTSIILMDKSLAKRIDKILFVKIENDGFDLGAQRRPIDKNDLPLAQKCLNIYKSKILNHKSKIENPPFAHAVPKSQIAQSGDYNLSGDRYRKVDHHDKAEWPMVPLGNICGIFSGARPKGGAVSFGVLSIGGEHIKPDGTFDLSSPKYIPEAFFSSLKKGRLQFGDVLIVKDGATTGKVGFFGEDAPSSVAAVNEHVFILRPDQSKVFPRILYSLLRSDKGNTEILRHKVGAAQGGINLSIKSIKIPLPPLDVQKEIVAEIDGYQKIIDAARQITQAYKPTIKINPTWPIKEMKDVCENIFDGTHFSPPNLNQGEYKYITSKNVRAFHIDLSNLTYVSTEDHSKIYSRCPVKTNDVLYVKDGANTGNAALNTLNEEFSLLSSVAVLRTKTDRLLPKYLEMFLNSDYGRKLFLSKMNGVAISRLTLTKLEGMQVPIPSLTEQEQIVAQIEAEQKIVNENKKLIEIFQTKISAAISALWS